MTTASLVNFRFFMWIMGCVAFGLWQGSYYAFISVLCLSATLFNSIKEGK